MATSRPRLDEPGGLLLDPSARILTEPGRLQVIARPGPFELRGTNLERLHERLAPALDGRITRAQLLASVGGHAQSVQHYLDALCAAGALNEEPFPDLPPGFPAPRAGRQERVLGSRRIVVSLAGPERVESGTLHVSFSSRGALDRSLLASPEMPGAERHIWIVCDRQADETELIRRAAVARLVLAAEIGRRAERGLVVFALESHRLALRRLAQSDKSSSRAAFWTHIGWMRTVETVQLPLVARLVTLPGLNRRRIGYGVSAEDVESSLVSQFIAREALLQATARGPIAGRLTLLGPRFARGPGMALPREAAAATVVSSTGAGCLARLVCGWVVSSVEPRGRDIDLLDVPRMGESVRFLQSVLRLRRTSLPTLIDDRLAPLILLRSADGCVAALDLEDAVCEVLARAVAREFSVSDPATDLAAVPSRLSPHGIRKALREVLARLPVPLRAVTGHIRWFGKTFFYGVEMSTGGGQRERSCEQ